ncbi:MAG: hypothetical protein M3083_22215 [Actinomycetota bacterium]|nr:hypothetical protein [Actinomycetota bacterium]
MPTRRTAPETQMVRGSLFTLRRRCGKPACRCATGDPHETPALAYPEGGRTKTLTLTGVDLGEVKAALARYDTAKADLDAAADAGIAVLRARATAHPKRRQT